MRPVVLRTARLADRVQGLAAALVAAGGGSHAPVALLIERSADLIVAMLAAQRAGARISPSRCRPADRTAAAPSRALGGHAAGDGRSLPCGLPRHRGVRAPFRHQASLAASRVVELRLHVRLHGSAKRGGREHSGRWPTTWPASLPSSVPLPAPRSWALVTTPTTDLGNTVIFPARASGGTLHVLASQTSQDPTALRRRRRRRCRSPDREAHPVPSGRSSG